MMTRFARIPVAFGIQGTMLTSRVIVYSDLNCPFCFALNEWLENAGSAERVRWRGVEHMPELLRGTPMSEEQDMELTSEVDSVRERAPNVRIERPPLRPNTELAIGIILSVEDTFPETVAPLRTAVFRALWQRGLDISNPLVLEDLIRSCGLSPSALPAPYTAQARTCFDDWDQANYRRIPVLRAPTGATYLGLGDSKKLSLFMGSALFDIEAAGSCTPS